ncbi:ty3-gypsy retrotransposon protein [Cucumis melo var. makuwa]|uniref:Ty3-gypsy retrotransposon protein n=1 Tax=Cucumis melo var. makuwa TaxID=1194695 RepID=A0A5D3DNE8_CUCMM|nr:ty3-gypsy retrotransposon protein [Cucumis melo var. makuwa]TYK24829.1 ty3-gypsy retrotransposon protein [Cucumis melo var. makuwa]
MVAIRFLHKHHARLRKVIVSRTDIVDIWLETQMLHAQAPPQTFMHRPTLRQGTFREHPKKITASQGNTSKALSDIGKRPNTRSRLREIQSSEDMSPFEVAKNIWEPISKPPKGGIVINENLVIDEHNSSSERSNEKVPHPNIMSVMVTDVDTSEDRMVELDKKG